MATKLTAAAINRLPAAPSGKRIERPDALAPGLELRINDKGRKDWLVRYRIDGRQRKMALGAWPGLQLAEAREKAHEARENAKAGIDPRQAAEAARRDEQRAAEVAAEASRSFGDLAEAYVAREIPRLADGGNLESLLRREILPEIGSIALGDFQRRHAVRLLDKLADSGRPGTAQKSAWLVKRIFVWAQDRDEIEINPVAGLKAPVKAAPRDRALSHGELSTLWGVWRALGGSIR